MSFILDGSFISAGTAFNLALPPGYTEFRMVNITDAGSAAANTNVMRAAAYSLLPAGYAYLNLKTNGAATLQLESMITTNGFTFFSNASPPVFAAIAVTAITAASPAQVTAAAHGQAVGNTVRLYSLNGSMGSMNGLAFTVNSIVDANNFTITFDASAAGAGQVGNVPATSGFMQQIIPSYWSPHNVVIGPTATMASGSSLLLNMNVVPSVSQGASQYSPFLRPYQVGAKLRLYMPTGYGTPSATTNFLMIQIQQINTQGGYAVANQLQCTILPGNAASAITTAAGLAALVYPSGGATYKANFPFVTDIAEIPSILSEAEDNTGIFGITIGTGVQTSGKTYQWFARKGFSI